MKKGLFVLGAILILMLSVVLGGGCLCVRGEEVEAVEKPTVTVSTAVPTSTPGTKVKPGSSTPTPEKPSGQKALVSGDASYKKHPSAEGKLTPPVYQASFNVEGKRRVEIQGAQNKSNEVLDVKEIYEWQNSSGVTIKRDEWRKRLLPDYFLYPETRKTEFPKGASRVVFWYEVKTAKPIPASLNVKWVRGFLPQGLDLQLREPFRAREDTAFEHWGIRFYLGNPTSKTMAIEVIVKALGRDGELVSVSEWDYSSGWGEYGPPGERVVSVSVNPLKREGVEIHFDYDAVSAEISVMLAGK